MNITKILSEVGNVAIMVNAVDLKEFFLDCQKEHDEEKKRLQEEADKNKQLISVGKVREMLGCSRATLWRWSKENYLKPIKIGNKVRYRLGDVLKIRKEVEV